MFDMLATIRRRFTPGESLGGCCQRKDVNG
jgi:hypothetical protein